MKQSRFMSAFESMTQVAVGYGIALGVLVVVFPWFNIDLILSQQAEIAGIFTMVSLLRNYGLRRVFEWIRVGT